MGWNLPNFHKKKYYRKRLVCKKTYAVVPHPCQVLEATIICDHWTGPKPAASRRTRGQIGSQKKKETGGSQPSRWTIFGRLLLEENQTGSGWWFGTWMDYDVPFSWEFHNPNWRRHIFQRGWLKPPTRDGLPIFFTSSWWFLVMKHMMKNRDWFGHIFHQNLMVWYFQRDLKYAFQSQTKILNTERSDVFATLIQERLLQHVAILGSTDLEQSKIS